MFTVAGMSLPEAYHEALTTLRIYGDVVDCPAYKTRCLELPMAMCVVSPLKEPRISRCFPGDPRSLEQYRQEMLHGVLDFMIGHGWDYTYHDRIADQLEGAICELKKDPQSRRACITIRRPSDSELDNPPCLQLIQFQIREGGLDMFATFRSNDAVKACYMNAFALTCLQQSVALELGVMCGKYTHIANSFHAYEADWATLDAYVSRYERGDNLTYRFFRDWDEQMADERQAIEKMVDELKERTFGGACHEHGGMERSGRMRGNDMKSVLLSIRPKWCEMIANGEKTIELRKSRPKLGTPFKCYIYCTLPRFPYEDFISFGEGTENFKALYGGGKVIGEFVCDDIDEISVYHDTIYCVNNTQPKKLTQMRLTLDDVIEYLGEGNHGYTWHISELVIYDKPKELREFRGLCKYMDRDCCACPYYDYSIMDCKARTIKRPPQSWCYVEEEAGE